MPMLTGRFEIDSALLDDALHPKVNFDLLKRSFRVAGRPAAIYFIDAFMKSIAVDKVLTALMGLTAEDVAEVTDPAAFAERHIPHTEVSCEQDGSLAVLGVLSGMLVLLIDGYDHAFLLDLRQYPSRAISEPEDDRVLRGAHDGFCENIKLNVALMRRRIRDPRLRVEAVRIGWKSQTDVALCYLDEVADPRVVEEVREKLRSVRIPSLSMGQESLAECLAAKQKWNPFPKIRSTERPDRAAASVLEGKVLVLTDNTPVVMVFPTAILDFLQDTNEFYFPPFIGTFLRLIRFLIFMTTLLLIPIWFLLARDPASAPEWLLFLHTTDSSVLPLLWQILIAELIIDGLKIASLNTPSSLSNAFGIVGALILGEFAVNTHLFVPEVLLYMSFVSVATFVQPSFQLGYTFKLFRLAFILLIEVLGGWGLAIGVVGMLIILAITRTPTTTSYLYPLIPFRPQALWRLLVRRSIHPENA